MTAPSAAAADVRSALERAELFARLPPETLDAVARVTEVRDLSPGAWLFREGDPGEYLFVIDRGHLEATRHASRGEELVLRTLGPGEIGGLTSLSVSGKRSASLRATEPSRVLTLPKRELFALTSEAPDLVQALVAFLSAKLGHKNRDLVRLLTGASDARPRIAFFDTKPYDRHAFEQRLPGEWAATFFETRVNRETAALAQGHRTVCAFVNDDLSAPVLEVLASFGVEHVAMRCAGFNNVDVAAAARLGLSVTRVPAYSPHAVAEHAVALVLTLNRKTHRAYNRVREGNFSLNGLVGFDLYGKVGGIVGLGKIGRALAEVFRGFGMRVLAHDAYRDDAFAAKVGLEYTDLETLLSRSDIVSLHAPLMRETHHLINAARIATMKRGAILVNTSRGGLVDTAALIEGLKSGHLGGAALDVYEEEGDYFYEDRSDRIITDDVLARLMTFNNVLITSHQAFLTDEALANIAETTLGNVAEFLRGGRGERLTNAIASKG
jgi:D-lactate dehydrogenase